MPEPALQRHVTVADVAEALAVEPSTVIALCRSGVLAGAANIALPGTTRARWRIPVAAVEQFLAARRSSPRARRKHRRKAVDQASYY